MLDDTTLLARLDSDFYGAMAHTAQLAARATGATLTAVRLLDTGPLTQPHYVCAARLGLSIRDEEALNAWVADDGSLFGYIAQRRARDEVFRVRDVLDEIAQSRRRMFHSVAPLNRVRDALCATFSVNERAWCALALLRCGDCPPFPPEAIKALTRLRPALARVVTRGYERETVPHAVDLRMIAGGMVQHPVSTSELLQKLSGTELHVLSYLRSHTTEREIASHLRRSPHTVHVHVKNIYRKLGVCSRKHLKALFRDEGVETP